MPEVAWKTKEGKSILPSQMDTGHLMNTLAMLRRNVEKYRSSMLKSMNIYMEDAPNGAHDACEAESAWLAQAGNDDVLKYCVPAFATLLAEAKRRGIR